MQKLTLDELQTRFSLQTRVDRKYLVEPETVNDLIGMSVADVGVLEIAGERIFDYRSTYFDTPNLDFYLASARRRRKRVKVRVRGYSSSSELMLEVKQRDGRGRTVKNRVRYTGDPNRLDASCQPFLHDAGLRTEVSQLDHLLTTRYRRMTFVDTSSAARMTFDSGLTCSEAGGRAVTLDVAVIETKSDGPPTSFDRWLWAEGHRPQKFSKYCTGLAALHPELPRNKWHRVLAKHF